MSVRGSFRPTYQTDNTPSAQPAYEASKVVPLNNRSAFRELLLDLTNATFEPQASTGYGIVFCRTGSNPAARLTIRIGGQVTEFAPGDRITGRFEAFEVLRSSLSAATGTARLVLITQPDCNYEEQPKSKEDGILRSAGVGPSGASTQTINSAAGNVPVSASDGVSLQGVGGYRAILSAASGQTLSGAGTIRLWYYDATLARWMRSQDLSYTVSDSGVRDIVFQDVEVLVPQGRVYAEAVSVTASGGALTLTVQTWGVA